MPACTSQFLVFYAHKSESTVDHEETQQSDYENSTVASLKKLLNVFMLLIFEKKTTSMITMYTMQPNYAIVQEYVTWVVVYVATFYLHKLTFIPIFYKLKHL
jgi:hypothetical protein